jgi:hypothetical protein
MRVGMHGRTMKDWQGSGALSTGGGWLVDEVLFRLLVDFEVQKAQRLRYSISLVCVAVEPVSAEGRDPSSPSVIESMTRHLRGTDAVATCAQGWLSMLLVDAETAHLPAILNRLTTTLGTGVWSAGGASYPRTATRADDMMQQAVNLMGRAKDEGGNRLYVAS